MNSYHFLRSPFSPHSWGKWHKIFAIHNSINWVIKSTFTPRPRDRSIDRRMEMLWMKNIKNAMCTFYVCVCLWIYDEIHKTTPDFIFQPVATSAKLLLCLWCLLQHCIDALVQVLLQNSVDAAIHFIASCNF